MAARSILGYAVTSTALALAAVGIVAFLNRPPAVEVGEARRETVERVLAVTGRVRPRYTNRVLPLVPGRLVDLARREGEAVERGEVLARLDDRQARAALEQALAAAREAEEAEEQARRDLARSRQLAAAGLVPARDLEADRLTAERAAQILRQRRQAVAEARARLDDYTLRSPLAGYVLERPVDPGQVVTTSSVIYELATAGEAMVEARVDELFLDEVGLGMEATVAPLNDRSRILPVEVSYIGRRVEPESGAATVRFTFRREPPDWPAGLSLDVNITVARHPDALTVPRSAVADPEGRPWVLVVDGDGVTARREVAVIDWPAPRVVVREGLEAGERVVLDPAGLGPGMEVRSRTSPEAARQP